MTEKTYIHQTKEHIIKENKFLKALSNAQTPKKFREAVMLLPDYKPSIKEELAKQVKAMGKKRFLAAIKRKQEELRSQEKLNKST